MSVDRVFRALSLVRPKTISQLAEETGLSYATVRKAVTELRAERIKQTVPHTYLRPELPMADVLPMWRTQRLGVAERIRTLSISESADPVELADAFLLIGRQLTEIGTRIDRVKMDPDWYMRLGGRFWLSEREEGEHR